MYLEETRGDNWWDVSKVEKTILSKSKMMNLEFCESTYSAMEEFVYQRRIFDQGSETIDSNKDPT